MTKKAAEELYQLQADGCVCNSDGRCGVCRECWFDFDECPLDECACECHCRCRIPTNEEIFAAGFESPIEQRFGEILWHNKPDDLIIASQVILRRLTRIDVAFLFRPYGNDEPSYIEMWPEEASGWISLAIFCDGHEFHERTKEQAARDRRIDRALQELGVGVARFTGSEIFRDPVSCVKQAFRLHFELEELRRGSKKAGHQRFIGWLMS